jgi:hypothetical protein
MARWTDQRNFIACRDCGFLQPVAAGTETLYEPDERFEAMHEFIVIHAGHRVAELRREKPALTADRPLWDPMATIRFEVTDGSGSFVVTCSRDSIDEPRTYRFCPGTLELQRHEVAIDDADLRRGLDLEFHPHAVRPTKLDRFISILHDAVRDLEPEELDVCYDAPDDPSVSIARMPEATFRAVYAACENIFDAWELQHVHRFLQANRSDDGLLVLRIRRYDAPAHV